MDENKSSDYENHIDDTASTSNVTFVEYLDEEELQHLAKYWLKEYMDWECYWAVYAPNVDSDLERMNYSRDRFHSFARYLPIRTVNEIIEKIENEVDQDVDDSTASLNARHIGGDRGLEILLSLGDRICKKYGARTQQLERYLSSKPESSQVYRSLIYKGEDDG